MRFRRWIAPLMPWAWDASVILGAFVATSAPSTIRARRALRTASAFGLAAIAVAARRHESDRQFRRAQAADAESYELAERLVRLNSMVLDAPTLPPLRGWRVSPDCAEVLIAALLERRPEQVVDLGSGASTILLALAVRSHRLRTELISIDHLAAYAEVTRKCLESHRLSDLVSVVVAPLEAGETGTEWYSMSGLEAVSNVGLLFVDGPPESGGPGARFPALPALRSRMSSDVIVVIDDAGRQPEREMVRSWSLTYPEFTFEYVRAEKGCCVGYTGARPAFLATLDRG